MNLRYFMDKEKKGSASAQLFVVASVCSEYLNDASGLRDQASSSWWSNCYHYIEEPVDQRGGTANKHLHYGTIKSHNNVP